MEKMRPRGAVHPVNVIVCDACGAIQGIVPLEESVTLIKRLSERVRRALYNQGVDIDMG